MSRGDCSGRCLLCFSLVCLLPMLLLSAFNISDRITKWLNLRPSIGLFCKVNLKVFESISFCCIHCAFIMCLYINTLAQTKQSPGCSLLQWSIKITFVFVKGCEIVCTVVYGSYIQPRHAQRLADLHRLPLATEFKTHRHVFSGFPKCSWTQ